MASHCLGKLVGEPQDEATASQAVPRRGTRLVSTCQWRRQVQLGGGQLVGHARTVSWLPCGARKPRRCGSESDSRQSDFSPCCSLGEVARTGWGRQRVPHQVPGVAGSTRRWSAAEVVAEMRNEQTKSWEVGVAGSQAGGDVSPPVGLARDNENRGAKGIRVVVGGSRREASQPRRHRNRQSGLQLAGDPRKNQEREAQEREARTCWTSLPMQEEPELGMKRRAVGGWARRPSSGGRLRKLGHAKRKRMHPTHGQQQPRLKAVEEETGCWTADCSSRTPRCKRGVQGHCAD